jgi:hypothetical protein
MFACPIEHTLPADDPKGRVQTDKSNWYANDSRSGYRTNRVEIGLDDITRHFAAGLLVAGSEGASN